MEERYEILGKIGQGGIGRVHRAFDHRMNRHVAIKRILTSRENPSLEAEATKQMMAEIGALSSLQHPHIVTVFDVGADEEGPYVVMELLEGKTLDEIVEAAPLTWDDFRIVAIQALEALIAAHALEMIHSDLKPPNIMLTWMPSGAFQIKIVDFGLATLIHNQSQEEIEKMESVYGSVYFMPPEQFERKTLDARSDLYSLGCCFYQALTGIHPFSGETVMDVMQAHLDHTVRPICEIRADIPPWVGDWVMAMIHRNPDDRPASAQEALEEFEQNHKKTLAATKHVLEPEAKPRLITSSSALASTTDSFPTVRETAGIHASAAPAQTTSHGLAAGFPTGVVQTVSRPKTTKWLLLGDISAAALFLIVMTVWMLKRNQEVRERNVYNNLFAMAVRKNVREIHLTGEQLNLVFDFILKSRPDAKLAPAYQTLTKATAGDGTKIDASIAEFATTAKLPPEIRRTLFEEVIGSRQNPDAIPPVIKFTARAETPDEAIAAFIAIRPMIREEHAGGLIEIMTSTDHTEVRQAAESKLSEIIDRSPRRNALATLITHAKEKSGASSREHFGRLLTQCGSPNQPGVNASPNPTGRLPGPSPVADPGRVAGTSSALPSQRESTPPPAAVAAMPPRPRRANGATLINTYDPVNISTTASSFLNHANRPELTVDGSGLEHATGEHANGTQLSWRSSNNGNVGIEWIQWDLGATYHLDSIHVWNYNDGVRFKSGINELDIYVSAIADPGDPEGAGAANWTKIGRGISFPIASGESTYTGFDLATETGIALPATEVRHVRFDLMSNHWEDGTPLGNPQELHLIGLAEIQFFASPEP